ncbi:MAG: GNAT family N-acetyltransferase [Desulfobacterales bacterium]|nr:GNAT family N-acetyltransferase [Desulfobacterales bacterium]
MNNVLIRRLKIEDTDEISQIYEAIIQNQVKADFKQLIELHAKREEDVCFVAELDGRVIGFMISYILTLGFDIEKSAWIATLGVNPEFMGQGIGERMARETFKLYQKEGIHNVYTSVRWDSPDLLSFFKTLGFNRSNFLNLHKMLD